MNTSLYNLKTAVEWQCAHAAATETWHHSDNDAHTYEFEGPDGDEITLTAWRIGDTVTVMREPET